MTNAGSEWRNGSNGGVDNIGPQERTNFGCSAAGGRPQPRARRTHHRVSHSEKRYQSGTFLSSRKDVQ